MDVESSICLSDLVPALRWSRPQQIAESLGDPRLPAAWWSSVALQRALGTIGLDWICERLARLAAARWDHIPLADLLPALTVHHVDPALPGWPDATRTAVAGLGGWRRLRRLTPADLATPSATPDVVMGAVFREVLGRLEASRTGPRATAQAAHPEVTRPLQRGTVPGQREAEGESQRQTGGFPAVPPGASPQTPQSTGPHPGGAFPAAAQDGPSPASQQSGPFPAAPAGPEQRQTGSFPPAQPGGTGSFPAVQPGGTGSFPASQPGGPAVQPGGTGSFPAPQPGGTGSFPAVQPGGPASQPGNTGAFPAPDESGGGQRQTGSFPAQPGGLPQRPSGPPPNPLTAPGGAAHPGPFPGGPQTGPQPGVGGPGANGAAPGQPLPDRPAGAAPGGVPAVPGSAPQPASLPGGEHPAPVPGSGGSAPSDTDHAMVRVVDGLFRALDKLELAVAVHRLFAEDPVSLRTLAHKMLVDRDALSQAQRTAEERVLQWLRSSESAPVTGHMFRLTEWLGAAATQEQLIGADPAHPVMVPSLRTPLWRVLVTLMPDRRLQDGWLVVGDIQRLQARTRQLLASRAGDTDVVELMTELGIRAHSAQAWLDALPAEAPANAPAPSAPSPAQPLPRRTPGANGHHHRGGQPIPAAAAGSIDPSAALATLSALSGGRSPALAGAPATPRPPIPGPSSDPRRWQRIEVTPEHLRGGPVPVPEGYAAQLGMRPGTLLSVTGPGDNAIVLVWQGHQPVFDSLQPVLMRLNARPGDQVYVTVDGYRLEAQLTG
ncbi:MAG: hypothetical protein K0R62_1791 [Nonomuraea muscovyensis]|nr:hypothetical protein [Nonomuraea muscovyensis]